MRNPRFSFLFESFLDFNMISKLNLVKDNRFKPHLCIFNETFDLWFHGRKLDLMHYFRICLIVGYHNGWSYRSFPIWSWYLILYSFVGYESKFSYVFPSSILLDMNPNSIYLYLLDVNPKFCLFLFVGYKSKFCLSLFVGCESKFCLALFVGYESKFCLSLVLLFFILLWLRVFFFYLYSLISHYW